MALNDEPSVDFVKTINRRTKVLLEYDELILSPTYPTDDPSVSRLRLTTIDGASYGGSEILTYDRLNLERLGTLLLKQPYLYPKSNTLHGILSEVEDSIGIQLTVDDVHDEPIEESSGVFKVQLKAKERSLRWYGSYLLEFKTLPYIDNLLTTTSIQW